MNFNFPRISKTNLETSVKYLQRHFLNHPAFFFLKQTNDRQIDLLFLGTEISAHCNALEILPQLSEKKICYRLHPKYTSFSYFLARLQSESLYFNEVGVTYTIFDILKEADWMLSQASPDKFCYMPTIIWYILWKYKYWCIQIGLCDIMQPLDM